MTLSIKCSDVGADCSWEGTAETEEELFKKIEAHAKNDHGFEQLSPELIEKAKAHIKQK